MQGVSLQIDPEALAPIIRQVVAETVASLEGCRLANAEKLAYSEQEAARLLSLEPHQLRDERLRGRIKASQIVGRRIRYTKQDLLSYLAGREFRK